MSVRGLLHFCSRASTTLWKPFQNTSSKRSRLRMQALRNSSYSNLINLSLQILARVICC